VTIYAADVDPDGEEVRFTSYQEGAPNLRPEGVIEWTIDDGVLTLDGTGSSDADGEIVSHDWYVATAQTDEVYVGEIVEHPIVAQEPLQITLVVTDDEGLTDFTTVRIFPMDIKPDSDDNTLNLKAKGVLPVALLSSAVFDATTIDTTTLRMGPGQAEVAHPGGHFADVNGDGLDDLMLHFDIPSLGADKSTTRLCVTGLLTDGQEFVACDSVTLVGAK